MLLCLSIDSLSATAKPWVLDRAEWLDLESWWCLVESMLRDEKRYDRQQRDDMRTMYKMNSLQSASLAGCCWCKYSGMPDAEWAHHTIFDNKGAIRCPILRAKAEKTKLQ